MPTSFTVDDAAKAALGPAQLNGAFAGEISRPRVRPLYLVGLALVAGAMILLPLLYLALIAAVGYGVHEHAVHNIWIVDGPAPGRHRHHASRSAAGVTALYIAPLVAGVALILFMTKPLFAPRPKRPEPFTLGPASNPVLYGYVEMLCRLMGAPVPVRIDVDEQVNASAGFKGGWWSMLRGRLVLTIGLPLAAGMTARELTGVLAHEFGHFTQRLAMRLGWIIGRINAWLARLAYERDAWDHTLERWQRQAGASYAVIIVLAIRLMIWLTRLILKGLVIVAHALSCFMSRQMEYDADAWQCRITGSEQFARIFDRIHLLGAGSSVVFGSMEDRWRERRLPDDLPRLIRDTAESFPPKVRAEILEASGEEKPRWFDTHPSRRQRQAAAAALAEPGVFTLEAPATALFADFESLCKQATYNHYRLVLGDEIRQATLVPAQRMTEQHRSEAQAADALVEFFMDPELASRARPRLQAVPHTLADARATAADLAAARRTMLELLPEAREATKRDAATWATELTAFRARAATGAGLKPDKDELAAGLRSKEQAHAAAKIAAQATDDRIAAQDPFRDAAERRILAALALYHHKDAARKIPTAPADLERAHTLISAYNTLSLARCTGRLIARDLACATRLLEFLSSHPKHQDSIQKLVSICRDLNSHVSSLSSSLSGEPYPFEHAAANLSMASFVVGLIPPRDHLIDVVHHARACLERFHTTRQRALMPLVEMTLRMEKALGLPPIHAKPAGGSAVRAEPSCKV